ncbi:ABC transporter ATP-binding protein [Bacillus sp. B1-b2]|uniref:ABC transporter ATP-binding protein n=1 Tax=Bacillus sp. B1-b2 TaxID=2653201 RepID=UPI001261DBA9|nr:ABC transporter ATP-binding protein [Bacillus sp. B1-b2]KAB7665630.1 ABC transporter ATP-binding protein [Bacillus sp. B1-b2]
MNAIQTQNVFFQQGAFQFQDLSLAIEKGKMTAIVGPNGSGKSTTLKLFARLLKAKQGEILLQDQSIKEMNRNEFARKITLLLQSKETLPNISVRELIAFGRVPYQSRRINNVKEDKEIVDWAIKECHLEDYENRMLETLSGGELQRVRIAMALAQKTDILLLDEPTTYLDIAHVIELMELMKKINHKYQVTIVMVLHELAYAGAYCDSLIVMKKGEVHTQGCSMDVLTSKLLKEVYEVDATVFFQEGFPLIIPNKN